MRTCKKHGEYHQDDFDLWCPICMEEDLKKQHSEEIKYFLRKSGIPKRFKDKFIDDYKANTQQQKEIKKVIKKYVEKIVTGVPSCLIMCGKPGTGKTHLACGILYEYINKINKSSGYVTTYDAIQGVKETYRKDSEMTEREVIGGYVDASLLVIDEVGVQFGTETEKLIFYQIINGRYEKQLPTIIISNLTQEELFLLIGERAFDRLKEDGGIVLAFDWESYRR